MTQNDNVFDNSNEYSRLSCLILYISCKLVICSIN